MDVMMLRRLLISNPSVESNVYIPNYAMAYMQHYSGTNGKWVNATYNNARVGFFGAGIQAGTHTTGDSIKLPVVKLPGNTVSITISFSSTSRLYNDNNVFVFWTKDEPSGTKYPNYAYAYGSTGYNARANNGALRVNTLSVWEGADSITGFFRVYPAIGENETPESIASALGFSIVFNKA